MEDEIIFIPDESLDIQFTPDVEYSNEEVRKFLELLEDWIVTIS